MTIEQEILRILTQARDEIRANMASKGINASGRTSASLTAERYGGGLRLYFKAGDVAPKDTLEIGRPGGKVPRNITDIIGQWSIDKGLNWGDEKARRRIAGAVGWGKIRKEGTDRNKKHEDVFTTPMNKAADEVRADIRKMIAGELHTAISKLQ